MSPRYPDAMGIRRHPHAPQGVLLASEAHTLYEVVLSAAPSPGWRAAFLRPPPELTSETHAPAFGRLVVRGDRWTFRATPSALTSWLRRIDEWIAYANSVVVE